MEWIISNVNMVTVILALAFMLPLISGAAGFFTKEQMRYSLGSMLGGVEVIAGIFLSVYLTKRIFFEHDGSFFSKIYDALPEVFKELLYGHDIMTYAAAVPLLLFILLSITRLVTAPLNKYVIIPLSDRLYVAIIRSGPFVRRLAGGLWELPRAIIMTLTIALIINFSMYYIYSPVFTSWINASKPYKLIYDKALYPVLNSNIAKKIPVLVNDTFGRTSPGTTASNSGTEIGKSVEKLTGGKVRIIEYFNGVTLDEAIKTNEKIDETAVKITAGETDDRKKAFLLYRWIAGHIKYDYDKAANIAINSSAYSSGSIPAFETQSGICFDYSCLYISMCRAAGLKVRLITGLGYSGTAWGDHAWNQVWYGTGERWINVDATFGSTGANYFDKRDFNVDHRPTEVQGEW